MTEERRAIARDVFNSNKDRKRKNMSVNKTLLSAIIDDNVTMIDVIFVDDGGRYTYKSDIALKVGDIAVAQVGVSKLSVVKVVAVDVDLPDTTSNREYRWIVSKVDTSSHDERLATENALINRVNNMQAKSVKEQLMIALGIESGSELMKLAHDDAKSS